MSSDILTIVTPVLLEREKETVAGGSVARAMTGGRKGSMSMSMIDCSSCWQRSTAAVAFLSFTIMAAALVGWV